MGTRGPAMASSDTQAEAPTEALGRTPEGIPARRPGAASISGRARGNAGLRPAAVSSARPARRQTPARFSSDLVWDSTNGPRATRAGANYVKLMLNYSHHAER